MNKDQSLLKASEATRISAIENMFITFPRQKAILDAIDKCHHQTRGDTAPRCLFINGPAGVGKSSIIAKYLHMYPRSETPEGFVVPVLAARIPAVPTIKKTASRLLECLGDPKPTSGTENTITFRIKNLLKDCKVELIILDEFQHLIDAESQKVLLNAANWLKDLINETGIPVVLTGMPGSETIFHSDQGQLGRRFRDRKSLEPFGWGSDESQLEFRTFLVSIDLQLPLPGSSVLMSPDTARSIYYATDGVVDHVMKLIKEAAKISVTHSMPTVTNDQLAISFEENIKTILPHKKNPFIEKIGSLSDTDPLYPPPNIPVTKRGKNKNISNVLTAS